MSLVIAGSRLRNRHVKVGSAAYDSGNTTPIKLPRAYWWRNLYLRLSGSMNIGVAGTVLAEAPLGLIAKIEIVADGRTIMSNSGRDFFRDAHFMFSKQPELVP